MTHLHHAVVSFDVGVRQLGGTSMVLSGAEMQLGHGETIADTARVLSRFVDAIMIRTFSHETLTEMAEAASVPAYVIFNDKTLIEMAEKRPSNLDEMARIGGVGAKKLDSYGAAFLEVINGAVEEMHPTRRKLAGRPAGDVFDRLLEVQADLARGSDGIEKPLSCSASLLAKVAANRPQDAQAMERLLGERRAERFGGAFLDVLRAAG